MIQTGGGIPGFGKGTLPPIAARTPSQTKFQPGGRF